ncbi:MAG: O-antigen ligase family protein [Solirubrobacterales bacterium]|nr:O-antigen ligase family protein [Solirubrobacterales bacterium]
MPRGRAGAARRRYESYGRSSAGKIADLIAFLVPFLLLSGLALGGGGYDLFARHLTGILAWVLVAVLLLGPWPDRIRPGRSLFLVGGLLLSLSLLSAISSIWSSSVSSSLAEFERGIGYLGIFTASYLTMRTPKQREWFARGIGAGLAVIVLLALGDRLIPGSNRDLEEGLVRLTYPLGYWNGDGISCGAAAVLFTWFAAIAGNRWWRSGCLSIGILGATALYLTYSRGGLLVAVIAMILLLFLSTRRLRVMATLVVVVAGTTLLLLVVSMYPAISGDKVGDPTAGESLIVILAAVVAMALAAAALEGLVRIARKRGRLVQGALETSRDRRLLLSLAGAAVAFLLVFSLAFGNNVWDQFTVSDVPAPSDAKSRFADLSGSGRYEFNRVALDIFADNPVLGSGAGTYPTEWTLRRDVPVVTQDAHSFYLENLAELGIPGGLLALAIPLSLIWLGLLGWRRRAGRDAPVMLALTVGLFFSLAFDWFWKLGATAALLMLVAAWITSAEAVEPERKRAGAGGAFTIAGLLVAWIAVVALAVPAAADHYIDASADSVRSGHLDRAVDQAQTASKLDPWSPEPHMQLGIIAESRGQYALALSEYNRAIELEPENWRTYLLRFGLYYDTGRLQDARRDLGRLRETNPVLFSRLTFREVNELAK